MKKLFLLLLFFMEFICVRAQDIPTKYFIQFSDKNQSIYSTLKPEEFLSQRSLHRRNTFHIEITTQDLPVNQNYVDSIISLGASLHQKTKWFNGAVFTITDSNILNQVNALSFVVHSEPVFNIKLGSHPIDTTITTNLTENTDTLYGIGITQINQLNLKPVHDQGYTGKGVWIGVMDAGFINLESIGAFSPMIQEGRMLGNRDFVDGDQNVFEGDIHGTYVMSCMAAKQPGVMVGTAPDATYTLMRTEQIGSERMVEEFNWIAAAEYADSLGIDVFNTSLGYTNYDLVQGMTQYNQSNLDGNTTYITRAADVAASKGIIVVNSAGNEGNSSWGNISAPSDGDSVFCIGAVDSSGDRASFSGIGPGINGKIKPNVVALGLQTPLLNHNGMPTTSSGTSFSGPIMTGTMACLRQAFPYINNWDLMKAVEKNASNHDSPNLLIGHGIPNLSKTYFSLKKWESYFPNSSEECWIFPNPITNLSQIIFQHPVAAPIQFSVFSSDGKQIKQWSTNHTISESLGFLSSLPNGYYVLQIQTAEQNFSRKLIISNP